MTVKRCKYMEQFNWVVRFCMIIMIIVASLIYILAGLLFASNAIISTRRFSTEEEQKDSEAITDRNFKTIGILMIIGAF